MLRLSDCWRSCFLKNKKIRVVLRHELRFDFFARQCNYSKAKPDPLTDVSMPVLRTRRVSVQPS